MISDDDKTVHPALAELEKARAAYEAEHKANQDKADNGP